MNALSSRQVRSGSVVGLDIGSSAVRGVELSRSRRGLALRRLAQVGLPRGAVVDGEILESGTVATALRRLWSEGGFSTRNVVLAISGQRVMVRQAEVPAMSEGDFRSALRFQATELVPIPLEDAVLDFVIIPPAAEDAKRREQMQILLGAAHRSVVEANLAVLREASLRVIAVDPAAMAAARAVTRSGADHDGTIALLDIGADLTMLTIRQQGRVRFSRTLRSGGSDLTDRLVARTGLEHADAEGLKRQGSAGGPSASLLVDDVDPLVSEIESSLSFFASQLGADAARAVLLTGGGSLATDLTNQLARRLPVPIEVLDPFEGLDCTAFDLDPGAALAAAPHALLPIGAAAWAYEQPSRRLTLVPTERGEEVRARRKVVALGAGVAVVAVGLAGLGLQRSHEASTTRTQANAVISSNAATTARIAGLAPVSEVTAAVTDRLALLQSDEADDIAWSPLLAEITAAMPSGTKLTSLSFNDANGSTSGSTSASSTGSTGGAAPAAGGLGSVTMSVKGPGSEEQVALWLRTLENVKGLTGVWVPSATVSGGAVTFTSTGDITTGVPLVSRPSKGGNP